MNKQLMMGDDSVTLQKISSTQMNSYTPEQGTLIYNTTTNTVFVYTGLTWRELIIDMPQRVSHVRNQDNDDLVESVQDLYDEITRIKQHLNMK